MAHHVRVHVHVGNRGGFNSEAGRTKKGSGRRNKKSRGKRMPASMHRYNAYLRNYINR